MRSIRRPPGSNIGALLGVALSSSCASLPLHHQQHQLEVLLSALLDIRRPPGSNIGALLGLALTSFSVALLTDATDKTSLMTVSVGSSIHTLSRSA